MMQMVSEIHSLKTSMSEWASTQGLAGASSLVGKTVTVNDGQSTSSGPVASVSFSQGSVTVQVNGRQYPIGNVTSVK